MKARPTVRDILLILGLSALVVGSVIAPGLPKALYYLVKLSKKEREKLASFDHRLFAQELRRLAKRGVVRFKEIDGKTVAELSETGKDKVKKYQLDELKIKRPKKWDGKWRLVVFDIPNKKKAARDFFRGKLKELGFFKLQESVFIHPFSCQDEIHIICELLGLTTKEVILMSVDSIEGQELSIQNFEG